MAVGELLLSAFFQVLFERLASVDLLNFVRLLQGGMFSELKKWEKNLKMIQAVLSDAEEKQLTDNAVKIWLDDLQDLAYDAEDILDEFATQVMKRKLLAKSDHASVSKVKNIFPAACFSCFNCFNVPSTINFHASSIRSKIKDISSRLDELCNQRMVLGLQLTSEGTSSTASQRRAPSSSVPTERVVYGRDEDKANVLKLVLSGEHFVIPIVGLPGVGKTTLAREVYNDKAVEDFKFDIKTWVCVSDDFDVFSISKALLESITSTPCDLKALNEVQVQLKKIVDGKKFLLVLDNVWNENYSSWETLKAPFMSGAPNSKMIVTTRHSHVASMMVLSEHYNLRPLSGEDCWSVFMMHAFESRYSSVQKISELFRKKVLDKCGGLPLAAQTLGGLLRSKRDDAWEDILDTKLWELFTESGILPVLRLTYHHLPSHLKRCFAYCAIFPKNYEFEEEELVLLWMAEGIIQQLRSNKQVEDVGREYFRDMVSRSIFQQSSSDSSKFIMHDLVHDLAQFVSGETSLKLEEASNKLLSKGFKRVRHSSYSRSYCDGKNKFELLGEAKHLRTFLPLRIKDRLAEDKQNRILLLLPATTNLIIDDTSYITSMVLYDLLPKFKRLRVLSLKSYKISQLPPRLEDLGLLRYLNLAGTSIKILPESISSLLSLQILILRDCGRLMKLPSKMKNLINLRHLDIMGANLIDEMPPGMKELKYLHTLSNFIVSYDGAGSSLKDLENLKFLCGELCISGLENVTDLLDVREAKLCEKLNLEALALQWSSEFDGASSEVEENNSEFDSASNEVVEDNVLDLLQPHKNIKRLAIRYYGGVRFSSWIGEPSFSKMEVLVLENCENCTSLPSLGLLMSLKHLTIKGMGKLNSIRSEIYGGGCSKPFQSLEKLHFENLPEWEYWNTNVKNVHDEIVFPRLLELSIVRCPKLAGKLPELLPSLETLLVVKCPELVVPISSLPMLFRLEVKKCKGLVCSNLVDPQLMESVILSNSSLDIYGCKGMLYKTPTESISPQSSMTISNVLEFGKLLKDGFQIVKSLAIGDSQQFKSWRRYGIPRHWKQVQGIQVLTHLEEVSIEENCMRLFAFPQINFLPNNLRSLRIENNKVLRCLPEGMMGNNSPLERMYIEGCDSLTFIVRGKLPSSLRSLEILDCQKLQHLVDDEEDVSISSSSVTLKFLRVSGCPELTTLSSGIQLFEALEYLYISFCSKLESMPEGLNSLNCLQMISIGNCPSLVSFPEKGLPETISSVQIDACKKLEALPDSIHKLRSLEHLEISKCPSIVSFPEEGLPTNLTSLQIEDPKMYKALIDWGLHKLTSLRSLWIYGDDVDAVSFPDEQVGVMLPSSLFELRIYGFLKLKYLSSIGFQSLTSLEYLEIWNCPKLTSFPDMGLPSSLLQLEISKCPLLEKQRKNDKGKEWSKIAHIPLVEIDHKFIHDYEEEE